jgi:hypothetical protein
MSMTDYLRRKQINAPVVKDTQLRSSDVSGITWRQRLAVNSQSNIGGHAINNVFDPSTTGTSVKQRAVQSFRGGFGGRNQDVSTCVSTFASTALGTDVFTSGKIQSSTVGGASNGCLTTTPASQVVSELGNAETPVISSHKDRPLPGLNMAYMRQQRPDGSVIDNIGLCNSIFNPQTESQFVDTLPAIKHLGVQSRSAWSGALGTQYGAQNPFGTSGECTTSFTKGNAKTSHLAGGLNPKEVIVFGKPDRPYNPEFAVLQTARTGEQVGTSNLPGTRATKVGAAMRKIPTGINHRGPQPVTKMVAEAYQINNGMRSVPAINNPPRHNQYK